MVYKVQTTEVVVVVGRVVKSVRACDCLILYIIPPCQTTDCISICTQATNGIHGAHIQVQLSLVIHILNNLAMIF
jgi:hypothetical protein